MSRTLAYQYASNTTAQHAPAVRGRDGGMRSWIREQLCGSDCLTIAAFHSMKCPKRGLAANLAGARRHRDAGASAVGWSVSFSELRSRAR